MPAPAKAKPRRAADAARESGGWSHRRHGRRCGDRPHRGDRLSVSGLSREHCPAGGAQLHAADPSAQLKAEVAFLIRRDGTVFGFKFVSRSGDYAFDLEAQGAIEKAATAFGPLPDGFHDDVLPVVFSFDPRLLH